MVEKSSNRPLGTMIQVLVLSIRLFGWLIGL